MNNKRSLYRASEWHWAAQGVFVRQDAYSAPEILLGFFLRELCDEGVLGDGNEENAKRLDQLKKTWKKTFHSSAKLAEAGQISIGKHIKDSEASSVE